jgi:hypothetical protein
MRASIPKSIEGVIHGYSYSLQFNLFYRHCAKVYAYKNNIRESEAFRPIQFLHM